MVIIFLLFRIEQQKHHGEIQFLLLKKVLKTGINKFKKINH